MRTALDMRRGLPRIEGFFNNPPVNDDQPKPGLAKAPLRQMSQRLSLFTIINGVRRQFRARQREMREAGYGEHLIEKIQGAAAHLEILLEEIQQQGVPERTRILDILTKAARALYDAPNFKYVNQCLLKERMAIYKIAGSLEPGSGGWKALANNLGEEPRAHI